MAAKVPTTGDLNSILNATVEQLNELSSVLGQVDQMFSQLGTQVSKGKGIISFQQSLDMLTNNIKDVIKSMADSFNQLRNDKELLSILQSLVSDPDTVEEITKMDENGNPEETIKKIKSGKLGLIDIITKYIGLVGVINKMEFPNFLTFQLKIQLFKVAIKGIVKSLASVVKDLQKNPELMSAAQSIEQFNLSLKPLSEMVKMITDMSKDLSKFLLLSIPAIMGAYATKLFIKALFGIVESLADFSNPENQKMILEAQISINALKDIINGIKSTAVDFILMGLLVIVGLPLIIIGWLGIKLILLLVKSVMKTLSSPLFEKDLKQASKTMKDLTLIILSIVGITVTLTLMGLLVVKAWKLITAGLLAVFVMIMAIMGILALLSSKLFEKNLKEGAKALLLLSLVMMVLSLVIVLVVLDGMLILSNLEATLVGFAVVLGVIIALSLVLFGLSFIQGQIQQGAMALIIMAGAMLVISVALILMAAAAMLWSKVDWIGALAVVGFITLFVGLAILAGFMSGPAIMGSVALLVLSGAMLVMAISLIIFAGAIMLFSKLDEESINKTLLFVGEMAIIIAGMGIAAPFILLGSVATITLSAAMIVLAVSILLMVGAIKTVEQIKDVDQAKENINKIISIFSDAAENAPSLKTIALAMFKFAGLSLIAMAIGNMAHVVSNVASLTMPDESAGFDKEGRPKAWRLMKEQDFENATNNIVKIATTLLFGLTNAKDPVTGKTVMDAIDDLSFWAMLKMKIVLDTAAGVSDLVDVIQNIANLRMPTAFDKDGKPIAFKIMGEEDFTNATNRIVQIMTSLLMAMSSEELSKQLEEMDSDALENMEIIMNAAGSIDGLVDSIIKMATFDGSKVGDAMGKIQQCIMGYVGMMTSLFTESGHWQVTMKEGLFGIPYPWPEWIVDRAALIDLDALGDLEDNLNEVIEAVSPTNKLIEAITKYAEQGEAVDAGVNVMTNGVSGFVKAIFGDPQSNIPGIPVGGDNDKKFNRLKDLIAQNERLSKINTKPLKENTDNFVKFIDKANSVDVDKIKTTTEMFEKMAKFSESIHGDFEKLADCLNEDILDAIKELNGYLSGENQSESMLGKAWDKAKGAVSSAFGKTEGETVKEEKKAEQVAKTGKPDYSEITSRIDQLKNALRSLQTAVEETNNKNRW